MIRVIGIWSECPSLVMIGNCYNNHTNQATQLSRGSWFSRPCQWCQLELELCDCGVNGLLIECDIWALRLTINQSGTLSLYVSLLCWIELYYLAPIFLLQVTYVSNLKAIVFQWIRSRWRWSVEYQFLFKSVDERSDYKRIIRIPPVLV